jgi:hypothetical protein
MNQFILSSEILNDHLKEPLNYFQGYGFDLSSILACGFCILSSPVPHIARDHLIRDFKSSGRFSAPTGEISHMLDLAATRLGNYIQRIAGFDPGTIDIVGFLNQDPVVRVGMMSRHPIEIPHTPEPKTPTVTLPDMNALYRALY